MMFKMNDSYAESIINPVKGRIVCDPFPTEAFSKYDGIKWEHPFIPGTIYKFRGEAGYYFQPNWLEWNRESRYNKEVRTSKIVFACTGYGGMNINGVHNRLYEVCLNTIDSTIHEKYFAMQMLW